MTVNRLHYFQLHCLICLRMWCCLCCLNYRFYPSPFLIQCLTFAKIDCFHFQVLQHFQHYCITVSLLVSLFWLTVVLTHSCSVVVVYYLFLCFHYCKPCTSLSFPVCIILHDQSIGDISVVLCSTCTSHVLCPESLAMICEDSLA